MQITSSQGGFSLIETLVAISILLTALAGPMTIAARGVFAANVARDQITAYFLGQDAMEYIRAARDGNGLASLNTSPQNPPWLTGLDNCRGSNYCRVDSRQSFAQGIALCGSAHGDCEPLKLDVTDANNPFYQYQNGSATAFTRSVNIVDVPGTTDEKEVRVQVSWKTGGLSRSVTLVEHLYNWQSF